MKWLLVVIVAGVPVKTDLVFPAHEECMRAEAQMRQEQADAFNKRIKNIPPSATDEDRKQRSESWMRQLTWGTCIPSK